MIASVRRIDVRIRKNVFDCLSGTNRFPYKQNVISVVIPILPKTVGGLRDYTFKLCGRNNNDSRLIAVPLAQRLLNHFR